LPKAHVLKGGRWIAKKRRKALDPSLPANTLICRAAPM
jgi:hypothetical protein